MKADSACRWNSRLRASHSAEVIFSMPREDPRRSRQHSRSVSNSVLQLAQEPKPDAAAARGSACCSHSRAEFPQSMQSSAELGLDLDRRTRSRSEDNLYLGANQRISLFPRWQYKARGRADRVILSPKKAPVVGGGGRIRI